MGFMLAVASALPIEEVRRDLLRRRCRLLSHPPLLSLPVGPRAGACGPVHAGLSVYLSTVYLPLSARLSIIICICMSVHLHICHASERL